MKIELNKKLVNVIIPAYKAHDFIERCLNSVYQQTWFRNNNFAVIVCVDGCQKTLEKLQEIKSKYQNLKILYCKENKGTYIALNTAFSTIETGTCIVFGADDQMNPEMISTVMETGLGGYVRHHGVLVTTKEVHNFFGGFYSWRCAGDTEILSRMKKVYNLKVYPMLFQLGVQIGRVTKSEKWGMNSKIRRQCRDIIHTERPLKHEPEINSFVEIKMKEISFNIATFPPRKKYLKQVVEDVYDKVDIIRVCLNGYKTVPAFLKREKIVAVIPENDMRDSGKFLWCSVKRKEIYFSADDDLLYSQEYFDRHIEFLDKNPDKVVTTHGRNLKPDAQNIKDFTFYTSCRKDLAEDTVLEIGGTGVMAFDLSEISFQINKCGGACDFGVGAIMADLGIQIVARAHSKDELEYILPKDEPDLWAEKPFELQKKFIDEIRNSKKDTSLKSYVINMPLEVSRLRMFRESESKTKLNSIVINPVTFKDKRLKDEIETLVSQKIHIDGIKKAKEISNRLTFSDILKNETAERIAIFEDDVYFKDGAKEIITKIMRELPSDFGICYLGCYLRHGVEISRYSENLALISGETSRIWGAHAIIFNKRIYKTVADMLSKRTSRITDVQISKSIVPHYKCFVAVPMIAFQSEESKKFTVGGLMHSELLNLVELEEKSTKYLTEKLGN